MRYRAVVATAVVGTSLLSACEHKVPKAHQVTGERVAAPPNKVIRPRPTCAKMKCVALTFDDGPGPHTGRLLDHLAKAKAHATFFVLGELVRPNAKVVRRMAGEGHELANHSWSHPYLPGMSSAGIRSEVRRTQKVIHQVTGVRSRLFRPPYGATNARVGRYAGLPQVLWSVDTDDWRYRSTSRTLRVVVRETRPGGIVLFHDVHPSTVKAVPGILTRLRRKGYRFVTVSELFRGTKLRPGRQYWKR